MTHLPSENSVNLDAWLMAALFQFLRYLDSLRFLSGDQHMENKTQMAHRITRSLQVPPSCCERVLDGRGE
jgi:hypothetical protein